MNSLLYMALKIPVNFLRNVLGVKFWLNDIDWCDAPLVIVPIKHGATYFGKITTIGICAPDVMFPVANAALVLTTFGVLPGVTLALARHSRRDLGRDPWLAFVMLYGATMFVLGTCTGASVYRLLTYGWPLFVFGMPILWKASSEDDLFDHRSLMAAQLGLSWLGPLLGYAVGKAEWWQQDEVAVALALTGILLNTWAYRMIRARRRAMVVR